MNTKERSKDTIVVIDPLGCIPLELESVCLDDTRPNLVFRGHLNSRLQKRPFEEVKESIIGTLFQKDLAIVQPITLLDGRKVVLWHVDSGVKVFYSRGYYHDADDLNI